MDKLSTIAPDIYSDDATKPHDFGFQTETDDKSKDIDHLKQLILSSRVIENSEIKSHDTNQAFYDVCNVVKGLTHEQAQLLGSDRAVQEVVKETILNNMMDYPLTNGITNYMFVSDCVDLTKKLGISEINDTSERTDTVVQFLKSKEVRSVMPFASSYIKLASFIRLTPEITENEEVIRNLPSAFYFDDSDIKLASLYVGTSDGKAQYVSRSIEEFVADSLQEELEINERVIMKFAEDLLGEKSTPIVKRAVLSSVTRDATVYSSQHELDMAMGLIQSFEAQDTAGESSVLIALLKARYQDSVKFDAEEAFTRNNMYLEMLNNPDEIIGDAYLKHELKSGYMRYLQNFGAYNAQIKTSSEDWSSLLQKFGYSEQDRQSVVKAQIISSISKGRIENVCALIDHGDVDKELASEDEDIQASIQGSLRQLIAPFTYASLGNAKERAAKLSKLPIGDGVRTSDEWNTEFTELLSKICCFGTDGLAIMDSIVDDFDIDSSVAAHGFLAYLARGTSLDAKIISEYIKRYNIAEDSCNEALSKGLMRYCIDNEYTLAQYIQEPNGLVKMKPNTSNSVYTEMMQILTEIDETLGKDTSKDVLKRAFVQSLIDPEREWLNLFMAESFKAKYGSEEIATPSQIEAATLKSFELVVSRAQSSGLERFQEMHPEFDYESFYNSQHGRDIVLKAVDLSIKTWDFDTLYYLLGKTGIRPDLSSRLDLRDAFPNMLNIRFGRLRTEKGESLKTSITDLEMLLDFYNDQWPSSENISPALSSQREDLMLSCLSNLEISLEILTRISLLMGVPEEKIKEVYGKSVGYLLDAFGGSDSTPKACAQRYGEITTSYPELKINLDKALEGFLRNNVLNGTYRLNLDDWVDSFGTVKDLLETVDESSAGQDDLIRDRLSSIMTILVTDPYKKYFPRTHKRMLELLEQSLDDVYIASVFIHNLDSFIGIPDFQKYVERAIHQTSIATTFTETVALGTAQWVSEEWVGPLYTRSIEIIKRSTEAIDSLQPEKNSTELIVQAEDKYAKHANKFTQQHFEQATLIYNVLSETSNGANVNLEKSVYEMLRTVNVKLDAAYAKFLSEVSSSTFIPEIDKQILFNDNQNQVVMTPLKDNVRHLVCRYLAQRINDKLDNTEVVADAINGIDSVLSQGFRDFVEIYQTDIPLYDKLYEEFDDYREAGRTPLEVYLGRDGVYAWLGRRSQDIARRRRMGYQERLRLKAEKVEIEIKPKYLIYPSYFRDNLNDNTRRALLKQEGISPDADPLFYDTGYSGSIPEQILRIMGMDRYETESRIRLLYAKSVGRRARKLAGEGHYDAVGTIEGHPKDVETSDGLYIDETGKLRPLQKPSSIVEQFRYEMVKQAINRHYWLQERYNHGPTEFFVRSEGSNTARVLTQFNDDIPNSLIRDPIKYHNKHLIRMGEGNERDLEISRSELPLEVSTTDLRSGQTEFSVLRDAKKSGLSAQSVIGLVEDPRDNKAHVLAFKPSGVPASEVLGTIDSSIASGEDIQALVNDMNMTITRLISAYRQQLFIDKHWKLSDIFVDIDPNTLKIKSITPTNFKQVRTYNSMYPQRVETLRLDA